MIDVDLRFSSRKTIGLQVDRDGRLIVRAPFGTPKKTIEQAVSANGAWIERAKEKQREKALRRPEPTAEEMKRYEAEARERLPLLVDKWSKVMGVRPTRLTFTHAKTRFGSCSGKNAVSFSVRLMAYPEEAVEYVVVHELAHIKRHDHSKAFWAEVARFLPDYKERKKLLK